VDASEAIQPFNIRRQERVEISPKTLQLALIEVESLLMINQKIGGNLDSHSAWRCS
jgi:hypothetical protein